MTDDPREGGRDRLADDRRTGRPPKLGPADLTYLDEALQLGPQAYGWPTTTWSIRDLQELLRRERRVQVSVYTVYRAVRGLGYRYRRPWHDLKHRQDAEAVASARQALAWLGKVPAPSPAAFTWSFSMNARSTATTLGHNTRHTYGELDYALRRVIWQTAPAKDAATFVAFLDQLAAVLPTGRILVVPGNVGYHKSHVARRWWVAHQSAICMWNGSAPLALLLGPSYHSGFLSR